MILSDELITKLVEGLKEIFGTSLERIVLYGSVAKGLQTEESDVDIALLVGKYDNMMHDKMIDLTVDLELEYDKILSVLLLDYENYKEWEELLPFYRNIKNDGVILWNAA